MRELYYDPETESFTFEKRVKVFSTGGIYIETWQDERNYLLDNVYMSAEGRSRVKWDKKCERYNFKPVRLREFGIPEEVYNQEVRRLEENEHITN